MTSVCMLCLTSDLTLIDHVVVVCVLQRSVSFPAPVLLHDAGHRCLAAVSHGGPHSPPRSVPPLSPTAMPPDNEVPVSRDLPTDYITY